jgi:hypothetical protein
VSRSLGPDNLGSVDSCGLIIGRHCLAVVVHKCTHGFLSQSLLLEIDLARRPPLGC